MRLFLNILTVVLVAAAAVVGGLWFRSYRAADVIESYRDVPPPPLGQIKPWGQRDRWREASVKSYPGRFEVVWSHTKVKGRRRGPEHDDSKLPGPVVNGITLTQYPDPGRLTGDRAKPVTLETLKSPSAIRESIGSWELDYLRPVKLKQADYQEIRQVKGRGWSIPYWMVVAALGAMPAVRLLNAFFRVGRAPVDSLGRRQEGAGFRGMVLGIGRFVSAASIVMIAATAALWAASRDVTLRLEGQPAGPSDFRTVVASRAGLLVKASPAEAAAPGGSPVARYRLTYDVPSAVVAPSDKFPGRVIFNRLGLYAAEGDASDAPEAGDEYESDGGEAEADSQAESEGDAEETDTESGAEVDAVQPDEAGTDASSSRAGVPTLASPAVTEEDDGDDVPPSSWLVTGAIDEATGFRWVAFVPYWAACVAFAVAPAIHLWLRVRPPRPYNGPRFGGVMGVLGGGKGNSSKGPPINRGVL